ncbi:MAG: hypothetical protein LBG84_06410 [Treponema sp.]|nr:hypothetical protein [Treponema sp.]
MNKECFICKKPSVIFYDFLSLEDVHIHRETIKYTQDYGSQRIAGIVRITLCADCLRKRALEYSKIKTKINGKPKLFHKQEVETCNNLIKQIDLGIFEKTPDMKSLFLETLYPSNFLLVSGGNRFFPTWPWYIVSNTQIGSHHGKYETYSENLRKRIINTKIESCYCLYVFNDMNINDQKPFSQEIEKINNAGILRFYYMDIIRDMKDGQIMEKLVTEIPKIDSFYNNHLKDI